MAIGAIFAVFLVPVAPAISKAILFQSLISSDHLSKYIHRIPEAPDMASPQNWKSFFTQWPAAIAQRGLLTTTLNEAMPFKNFWLKDDMLLLERTNPDALGGRFILLSFDVINTLKFTVPLQESVIAEAGFVGAKSNLAPQPA